jgi:hypothetical protein
MNDSTFTAVSAEELTMVEGGESTATTVAKVGFAAVAGALAFHVADKTIGEIVSALFPQPK